MRGKGLPFLYFLKKHRPFSKNPGFQKLRPFQKRPSFFKKTGFSEGRPFHQTPSFFKKPGFSEGRPFHQTPSFFKKPGFSEGRPFHQTPSFFKKPGFSEGRPFHQTPSFFKKPGFLKAQKYAKTRASHYTFIICIYFKMSEHYRREFDLWLEAFKQGDLFEEIVEGFDQDWSSIYKELHRIFKRDVWNQVLEQRARERDQYNDRVSIAKSTERRTDHISLF